jgi:hypothetical protein
LAEGGCGEKECGRDWKAGDEWGHSGSWSLRIEDSFLFGIRKGDETWQSGIFGTGDKSTATEKMDEPELETQFGSLSPGNRLTICPDC